MENIKQNKIQEYRIKKNMSQQKLAELMKVKQNTISQWERGERAPTLDKAIKLADILETTVESLYK